MKYQIRLKPTLDCIRLLICQGLRFRGLDECEKSNNICNFLEVLKVIADQNEPIERVVFDNAPEN